MINLQEHKFSPYSVIVSRVARVIENPYKIEPISCTIIALIDSYHDYDESKGENFFQTISGSKVYCSKVLKSNAGVVIDMSALRPKGTVGSAGLIASGVTNFMPGYSVLCREIARGNSFKRGAVVLALDFTHPDLEDFLAFPNTEIPWAKRSVTVNDDMWLSEYAERRQKLFDAVAAGTTFVYKEQYNEQGKRLYTNVCHGLSLKSRSTCCLMPLNLGLISDPKDIPKAMVAVFKDLSLVWDYFNETRGDHFLPPTEDPQIGLGYIGFSNFLSYFGVTYQEMAIAFQRLLAGEISNIEGNLADSIAFHFNLGYRAVAKENAGKFCRVFAIEPTASCSYKQKDLRGFTTTPEISPPVCHPVTKVSRRQAADGYWDYQYPLDVEVAGVDVPWQVYDSICESFQTLANSTGLAQGISYNWWLEKRVDEDTFKAWYDSPLKTIYYRWQTASLAQDKSSIGEQLEGADDFWGSEEDEEVVVGNSEIACECGS